MAENAQNQNALMDKLGLKVQGLVSEVSSYPDKKTGLFKYSVHLFIPGNALMKVSLKEGSDPQVFMNKIGQPVSMKLSSREWNGNTFFSEA
jgi:hypothetical protein